MFKPFRKKSRAKKITALFLLLLLVHSWGAGLTLGSGLPGGRSVLNGSLALQVLAAFGRSEAEQEMLPKTGDLALPSGENQTPTAGEGAESPEEVPEAAEEEPPAKEKVQEGEAAAEESGFKTGAGGLGGLTGQREETAGQPEAENREPSSVPEPGAEEEEKEEVPLAAGTAVEKETFFVIDGQQIDLKDPMLNLNGRTYYPFRACLEAMGAEVSWDGANQTATGLLGNREVIFAVGSQTFSINGQVSTMQDATVFLDEEIGRIYIPIRYAAEALGFTVNWHKGSLYDLVELISPEDLEVVTGDNALSLSGNAVYLGQSLGELTAIFGRPSRIDPSPYGLNWYVYNRDYDNFIMVGVADRQVKGFFCNSKNLLLKDGLGYGSTKTEVEKAYGSLPTMEFWFDPHDGEKLYAVWCMEQFFTDGEMLLQFQQNPEQLLGAYEQECLDITNAFRVAQGKPVVLYDAAAARVAYAYAKDLAERNFFDHKDPEGRGPMERMAEAGLDIHKVTENLARGYGDAILVFQAWVNSASHRQGMLEDNVYLGVGAYYKEDSKGKYYFVQEFITPW